MAEPARRFQFLIAVTVGAWVLALDAVPVFGQSQVGVDLELVHAVIERIELRAAVPMVSLLANGGRVELRDVAISTAEG